MFGRKRVLQTVMFYKRPLRHGIAQTTNGVALVKVRHYNSGNILPFNWSSVQSGTLCRNLFTQLSREGNVDCMWFQPNHDLIFVEKTNISKRAVARQDPSSDHHHRHYPHTKKHHDLMIGGLQIRSVPQQTEEE